MVADILSEIHEITERFTPIKAAPENDPVILEFWVYPRVFVGP